MKVYIGRGSQFRPGRGFLDILDPDGNVCGTLVFISDVAAEKFASAARNVASAMADDWIEFNGFVEQAS